MLRYWESAVQNCPSDHSVSPIESVSTTAVVGCAPSVSQMQTVPPWTTAPTSTCQLLRMSAPPIVAAFAYSQHSAVVTAPFAVGVSLVRRNNRNRHLFKSQTAGWEREQDVKKTEKKTSCTTSVNM